MTNTEPHQQLTSTSMAKARSVISCGGGGLLTVQTAPLATTGIGALVPVGLGLFTIYNCGNLIKDSIKSLSGR